MKSVIAILLLVVLSLPFASIACTTFLLRKNNQLTFGKNYDWETGTGVVHTNLRGKVKTSLPVDGTRSFQWTSRFGSVTFNQYGKEFPNGGMNEKGLVVELMWLNESKYPPADERPSISVLQWIQYQLDNCSTIEEVINSDKKLRVTSSGTPQHYLVADANGHAATIEFLNGKMEVHTGDQLPYAVLANDPYEHSVQSFKQSTNGRFTTACKMVQQFEKTAPEKPLVPYSFDVLKQVAQGNYTKWSIVYDISNKQVFFKTLAKNEVKNIDIKQLSFNNTATPLSLNMNIDGKGDITHLFVPFSSQANQQMLKQAFKESANRIEVPNQLQDAMATIANNVAGSH
jgi:penicillin V acylase-like amidase (Ntn superfamily)